MQKKLPAQPRARCRLCRIEGNRSDRHFRRSEPPDCSSSIRGHPDWRPLNARRPNQTFQRAVTADKSIGNSIYHSLQVKAERRMATGLTFLTAYTWSKSISGPSDIGGQVGGGFYIGGIQDVYNLQAERAVSGFDVPHRFVQTVLYDLPFFKSSCTASRSCCSMAGRSPPS